MPSLEPAVGPLLDQILDANYDIWNEGLSRKAYWNWWAAQLRTEWAGLTVGGRPRLSRTALAEGGRVLASAKEYLFDATLDGRSISVVGIGAVFTQPARRRRGYAALLIEQLLARAQSNGADLALLFSEIGASYYERLGFTALPMFDLELQIERAADGGAPAMLVRHALDRDLSALVELNRNRAAPYRFHLDRDASLLTYSIDRKRLLTSLGPPGRRPFNFFVAEEGGSAAAYVVIAADPRWTIEECGDRDPSGARVGAMLQLLLARDPAAPVPPIRAWLPPGLLPPQVSVTARRPSAEIMMVRPLTSRAEAAVSLGADDICYWRGDVI
jgi:GNAT superfamily N-acetyltransferase